MAVVVFMSTGHSSKTSTCMNYSVYISLLFTHRVEALLAGGGCGCPTTLPPTTSREPVCTTPSMLVARSPSTEDPWNMYVCTAGSFTI